MLIRIKKVAKEIKKIISIRIIKGLKVPICNYITISDVLLSSDLKYAKIYFSILGSKVENLKTKKILISQSFYFKKELSKKLKLRNIPKLTFIYDNRLEKLQKIEQLLQKL
jgi:ribosome-binding factor A